MNEKIISPEKWLEQLEIFVKALNFHYKHKMNPLPHREKIESHISSLCKITIPEEQKEKFKEKIIEIIRDMNDADKEIYFSKQFIEKI